MGQRVFIIAVVVVVVVRTKGVIPVMQDRNLVVPVAVVVLMILSQVIVVLRWCSRLIGLCVVGIMVRLCVYRVIVAVVVFVGFIMAIRVGQPVHGVLSNLVSMRSFSSCFSPPPGPYLPLVAPQDDQ